MDHPLIRIGVLFSRTGSYRAVGEAMYAGAELAIAEVNDDAGFPFALDPQAIDPGGRIERYTDAVHDMLTEGGISHVVGCYTSSSRKEVLPLFEKYDALLWYPSHYEGFETSDNVIYTGAAPNQHIVPLANYLLANGGKRGWFVGSNYIWAWENNRIMREMLQARDGAVLGERYVPVGDTDLTELVARILASRPDFVFNTLIGESSYRFHRLLRAALDGATNGGTNELPVASCSLAEPELRRMGEAAAGHLSSSVYFSTLESEENRRFAAAWRSHHPDLGHTCADAEAAYIAVHLLARAIRRAGDSDFQSVRQAAMGLELRAPQGPVRIDPETRHCYLRPRIGRSRADGTFDIVYECPTIVRPDPYLVWESLGTAGGTALRVVS